MSSEDRDFRILKGLIALGGGFEFIMGIVVMLWGDLVVYLSTGMTIMPTYALYWRSMGLLAVALGSLQLVASNDPQRYIAVPIAAIFVRLLLQILTFIQVVATPSMALMLIAFSLFDLLLAVLTLLYLYRTGLLRRS
ncbi:MAG: hypothetical protein ACFE7R_06900 [Candidatus Hodarchaeota archaeon]